jgi:hypothetical protein
MLRGHMRGLQHSWPMALQSKSMMEPTDIVKCRGCMSASETTRSTWPNA